MGIYQALQGKFTNKEQVTGDSLTPITFLKLMVNNSYKYELEITSKTWMPLLLNSGQT